MFGNCTPNWSQDDQPGHFFPTLAPFWGNTSRITADPLADPKYLVRA